MRPRVLAAGYYLLVGLVTALLTVPLLHLTSAHLSVPFNYEGDGLAGSVHVKAVLEQGWFDFNPAVGAPEGRHGNDFPGADNLHLMVVWLLGLGTSRFGVALNAYFLLTFPLTAMAAAWFFRVVGLGRVVGAGMAVLYAFAPYHLYRGEGHLFLAAYYVVPLAGLLLYRAVSGEPLWSRSPGRVLGTVACLVLLGTASSYYSLFALMLLPVGALVAVLQDRRWRRLLGVAGAMVLLVAVMVANMLPNLLYERAHGANLSALVRAPRLTEVYSFKLASLLLPARDHRIAALADYRRDYDATFPLPSEQPTLGLVAAVGLVFLLAVAVLGMATVVRRTGPASDWWTAQRRLATLTAVGFLLGTVGGLSTFFALFVTDSIRGWNRLSIYLALFALASVGLLLQRISRHRVVAAAVCGVVVVVGLLDQVPADYPHARTATLARWGSDTAFVAAIEKALPDGAMVMQLPYLSYPEASPRYGMSDADPFRMYLHSQTLRWSYGGIKGRPDADWQAGLDTEPADRLAALGAIAGFDGIEVDRFGYADKGVAFERGLARTLGVTPVVSGDQRFTFWDVRAYRASLESRFSRRELDEVRTHVLHHPVAYGADFRTATPRVAFDNPLPTAQVVDATVTLIAPDRPSAITFRWPDGAVTQTSGSGARVVVTRRLTLPPGRSFASVATPAGATTVKGVDAADVRYRFRAAVLPDEVLAAFRP